MKTPSLTIIDDENVRGVIAPKRLVSKEVLEDIIDLVELSVPAAAKETERRIRDADRKNSWIPFEKVYARLKRPHS